MEEKDNCINCRNAYSFLEKSGFAVCSKVFNKDGFLKETLYVDLNKNEYCEFFEKYN